MAGKGRAMKAPVTSLGAPVAKDGGRWRVSLFPVVALIVIFSAAYLPAEAQERQVAQSVLATQNVIILPPQVVSERLSENSAANEPVDGAFATALTGVANSSLASRRYTALTQESLPDPNAISLLKQLEPLTSRLARGAINDDAQQILARIGTLPGNYLILVQFMKIKKGSGGTYDPWSGAITSGMSSTLFQAALISPSTGRVVWKNEVLERKAFPVTDPRFSKSVETLYQTLNPGERNR